jgi:REP element-mobilizing transposase RayT
MNHRYKIKHNNPFYITFTVTGWIDVFTQKDHINMLLESIDYCQTNKGLKLYAWCLLPSRLHMIVDVAEPFQLWEIVRDLKKFTAKKLESALQEETETKREWLLDKLSFYGRYNVNNQYFKLWQEGYRPIELYSQKFFFQKLDYIHSIPVKELIVTNPWDYNLSSAKNYAGMEGLLQVQIIARDNLDNTLIYMNNPEED